MILERAIKVCHLTSVHPVKDTRIFYKECRSLCDVGYDVTLIAQNDRDEIFNGIKIKGLAKPKNRLDRLVNTVKQVYMRALEVDADIYHLHDPELLIAGRLLLKRSIVIFDMHENLPKAILHKNWLSFFLRRIVSQLINQLEKVLLNGMFVIFELSPYNCVKSRSHFSSPSVRM